MSVEAIATVLHHSKATGTAKVVLIGIANHAGDGGSWPTVATLAKYAGVSERNVQLAVRKLEDLGEIRVHLQAGGNQHTQDRYRSNRYDILVVCPPDCDRSTSHRCASDDVEERSDEAAEESPNRGDGIDTPTPQTGVTEPTALALVRGVDIDASGVSPASPEPSYNHPDTPQPPDDLDAASSIRETRNAKPVSRCPVHPAGDGKRCRGCGTNPKAVLERQRREAAAAARAAELKQQLRDREEARRLRTAPRSPATQSAIDEARRAAGGRR